MAKRWLARVMVGVLVGAGAARALGETTAAAATTEPAGVPTTQAVLKDLSSDEWRVRQEALAELVKRGRGAEGTIEQLLQSTMDPSVQADLRAALGQIQDQEKYGATPITMHLKGASPAEVFKELGKQAGVAIEWGARTWVVAGRQPAPPGAGSGDAMDADFDGVPFWQAAKELCASAHMSMNFGENGMMVYPGWNGVFNGPTAFSGPCMVVVTAAHRSRSMMFGQPGGAMRTGALSVQMTMLMEPKVKAFRSPMVQFTQAEDELGDSLLQGNGSGAGWNGGGMGMGQSGMFSIQASLKDPPEGAKTIARLKGSVRLTAVAETAHVETTSDQKAFSQLVPGMRVRVTRFEPVGEICMLRMSCIPEGHGAAWQTAQDSVQSGQVRIIDAQGRPLLNRMAMPASRSAASLEVSAQFSMRVRVQPGAGGIMSDNKAVLPLKLVWDVPTETKELTIPFEFKDLPLP